MYRYTDVWPYKVTSNLWTVFYFRSYTTLLCSRDLIFAIHDLVVFNILWTFCLFWFSFCCIPLVILYYFVWWFVTVVWIFTVPSFHPPLPPCTLAAGRDVIHWWNISFGQFLEWCQGRHMLFTLFINLHNLIPDGKQLIHFYFYIHILIFIYNFVVYFWQSGFTAKIYFWFLYISKCYILVVG